LAVSIFVSYVVDYHTFLLTNFSAGVSNTWPACDPRRHFVRPAMLTGTFQMLTGTFETPALVPLFGNK